jgi:hypothetical protein
VGCNGVHLPDGLLLNARRVSTLLVPRAEHQERHDHWRRRSFLSRDLWEDPTFSLYSLMRDVSTREPDPHRHSSLLGDVYYHYGAPLASVRQVHSLPPVEEEAIQKAIE